MRYSVFLSALLVPAATAFEYHTLLESILGDYAAALEWKKQKQPDPGCREYLKSATSVQPTAAPAITEAHIAYKVAGDCPMTAAFEIQEELTNYSKDINSWAKSVVDDLYKYSLCGFDSDMPSPTPTGSCPLVFVDAKDVPTLSPRDDDKGPKETGAAAVAAAAGITAAPGKDEL